MIYVFDTSSFRVFEHYFPERFLSFWARLDEYVSQEKIISTKEVLNELENQGIKEFLNEWMHKHKQIFLIPSSDERQFVKEIFNISHFQQLVSEKNRLKGNPVADPFVISLAKVKKACVVTEETKKKNSSRIPNVCEYFDIDCTNLDGFMMKENWSF